MSGSSRRKRADIRFGLCCLFCEEPVKFRTTTAAVLLRLTAEERREKLSKLCLHNAENLERALEACVAMGIGAFRIQSQLLPRYTHPEVGYRLEELPDGVAIFKAFARAKEYRAKHDLRLSFHPDQFVVLTSPHAAVVHNSILELEYQNYVSELVGAEMINIHAGGSYGDKAAALERFAVSYGLLSPGLQRRLTVENDDVSYTVEDLLPLCGRLKIPLVYDVHHHRCLPDALTQAEATRLAAETWTRQGREPYFHLSSPREGWGSGNPRPHADYIDVDDYPEAWSTLRCYTVDVEAKAKELAVVRLREALAAS
jgi:UV DNA damage endonuclease